MRFQNKPMQLAGGRNYRNINHDAGSMRFQNKPMQLAGGRNDQNINHHAGSMKFQNSKRIMKKNVKNLPI